MAKRPAPPSGLFGGDAQKADAAAPTPRRVPRRPPRLSAGERRTPKRRVDVRGWLGGIRLSGFMVVMLGLVVLAAFVLVPTFGNYVQQRQHIAALEQTVQASREEVADLEAQQDRWSDPAYITTQARERLYYTSPGEVVYLIVNDLEDAFQPAFDEPVSAEVTQTRTDWMTQLLASVTATGLAQTIRAPDVQPAP